MDSVDKQMCCMHRMRGKQGSLFLARRKHALEPAGTHADRTLPPCRRFTYINSTHTHYYLSVRRTIGRVDSLILTYEH